MSKRDSILKKIQALRAKIPDNGATEDEAKAAAEMADRLMREHEITEAELSNVKPTDFSFGYHDNRTKTIHPVNKFTIMSIANFCEVRCWWDPTNLKGVFFGLEEDVAMAEYLTDFIRGAADRAYKEYLKSPERPKGVSGHQLFWSFMQGFCGRINTKLKELREARQEEIKTSTGTDILVLKKELATAEMQQRGITLRKTRARGIKTNGSAYDHGRAAGDRVSLDRPLGGSGKAAGRIS